MCQYVPKTFITIPPSMLACEVVVNRIAQLRPQDNACGKFCWTVKNIVV